MAVGTLCHHPGGGGGALPIVDYTGRLSSARKAHPFQVDGI